MGYALQTTLTEDDYLRQEALSPVKHEFVYGKTYAMAGASERHNLLAGNLFAACHGPARAKGCRPFMSDMRLRLDGGNLYYYPDVMLVCDPQDSDPLFKTSPCLVAEVMSPATAQLDQREKLINYQKLPSLREYLLLAQDEPKVQVYHRVTLRDWGLTQLGPDDVLHLQCLDLALPVRQLYDGLILT